MNNVGVELNIIHEQSNQYNFLMNMLNFWHKACLPKDSFDGMIVK